MPDFQDRVIQGSGTRGNVGTYKSESLPNIKSVMSGGIPCAGNGQTVTGAFTTKKANDTISGAAATNNTWITGFDASRSSSTYQNNSLVQQNALLIQCCIKY